MKEKLTDKQVLEKIEKYMRLTKMPETDYYDISIGEITALVHMDDVCAAIARAYFSPARYIISCRTIQSAYSSFTALL